MTSMEPNEGTFLLHSEVSKVLSYIFTQLFMQNMPRELVALKSNNRAVSLPKIMRNYWDVFPTGSSSCDEI